ncbi:phage portal protein family protein [Endozoicomonas sp. ALC020]|uniref:phage portal protein family protein n=1 Tax=unclassified Endozoicomonas TaxID=2644528 RepID=UPI003BAF446A
MAKTYTSLLLSNPDRVLQQRGRDLKLYEEILRDDQVKSCFQQRRLAFSQSEWDAEPASESPEDVAAAEFIAYSGTSLSAENIMSI